MTTIRPATPADAREIHALICELAVYEREPDAVESTVEQVHDALFVGSATPSGTPAAYALVIDDADEPGRLAAVAIYFLNFSTWLGKHGIYLEDLFVRPEFRGRGYGKAMLESLAQMAVERGYGRFEWWVLNWNTPAWEFYASRGAVPMSEWTVHRVSGVALQELAAGTRNDPDRTTT